MLHLCEHYSVSEADVASSPGMRDQVDGFCRAAYEYDFVRGLGVDETGHFSPSFLMGRGGFLAYLVDSTMNVRIILPVVPVECLDDLFRFLGCGRVVEIDQGFPVDDPFEDWKVFSYLVNIVRDGLLHRLASDSSDWKLSGEKARSD